MHCSGVVDPSGSTVWLTFDDHPFTGSLGWEGVQRHRMAGVSDENVRLYSLPIRIRLRSYDHSHTAREFATKTHHHFSLPSTVVHPLLSDCVFPSLGGYSCCCGQPADLSGLRVWCRDSDS
jgi:hypothetical protein